MENSFMMNLLAGIFASFLMLGAVEANFCKNVTCGSSLEMCIGNATHVKCVCKDGYFRAGSSITPTCEKDCDIHYCFYGGKCERGPNGRVCRCVSPYHGIRCENEKRVSIQIAVGSAIMAVALIIFLAVIIWKNNKEDAKVSEKALKPWECEKGEQIQNCEFDAAENENKSHGSEGEAQVGDDGPETDETPARYETVVQITPNGKGSPKERSSDAGVSNVYVNVVAEEEIASEVSKTDNQDSQVNEEKHAVGEEKGGKGSTNETAMVVSNVYIDADDSEPKQEESAL